MLEYASTHGTTLRIGAALMLGSAFPLLVYAATAWAPLRRVGITAPAPLMGPERPWAWFAAGASDSSPRSGSCSPALPCPS